MTTLHNRPNTAVLVIDVQNKVVEKAHDRDAVVANINRVVDRARQDQVPIVWIQHVSEQLPQGDEAWKIVPELQPAAGEPVVQKRYPDSFEDTGLEDVLAGLGVGRLVVTGAQTDACIRSTLHGGLVRGYDVVLVKDAHTTEDLSAYGAPPPGEVIAHTNLYWAYQTAPGRKAAAVEAGKLDLTSNA